MQATNWGPTISGDVKTDPARYGIQGLGAFIKNRGLCYKPTSSIDTFGGYAVATETDKTCSYEPLGLNDWCAERCKTQDLDVQV